VSDPKNEVLAPSEFICKICWQKFKGGIKYSINHLLWGEAGYEGWSEGTPFIVCEDCMCEMQAFIDIKAQKIISV